MNLLFIVNNPVGYTRLRDYFESQGHQVELVHNYKSATNIRSQRYSQVFYERFTQGAGPKEILDWCPTAKCLDEIGSVRSYIKNLESTEEPVEDQSYIHKNALLAKKSSLAKYETEAKFNKPYFVGTHKLYLSLYNKIKYFAPILNNFLIVGESGTGKEYTAYEIHKASGVSGKFVSVDCGVLNDELLASELFGHVKGSFTGAVNNKTGYLEVADNGTIFLDEVENLSYKGQISLLRVLQERVYSKVGGTTEYPVTCKVICSTNVDLQSMVDKKRFRLDLYHRINQITLNVPALKDINSDLPELIDFLIKEIEIEYNIKFYEVSKIKKQAINELYPYPGNIRQLKQWLISKAFNTIDTTSNLHGIELMRTCRL